MTNTQKQCLLTYLGYDTGGVTLLGHEKLDTTMIYAKTSSDSVKFGHQKHVI